MMTKEGPTNPLGKRSCAWAYIKCIISLKISSSTPKYRSYVKLNKYK